MWKAPLVLVSCLALGCEVLPDPTGGSSCADDEVENPDGGCWARCRGDQRWLGDRCSSASGQWVADAAQQACGETGRLVSKDDVVGLLDNCSRDADGTYRCYRCSASGDCSEMYAGTDVETSRIWTSTPCTLPPPLTGKAYYLAYLDDGQVSCFWADMNIAYPLCVRD